MLRTFTTLLLLAYLLTPSPEARVEAAEATMQTFSCADHLQPKSSNGPRELSLYFVVIDGYAARKSGVHAVNSTWFDAALDRLRDICETRPEALVADIWTDLKKTLPLRETAQDIAQDLTTVTCFELTDTDGGSAGRSELRGDKTLPLWLLGFIEAGRTAPPWFAEDSLIGAVISNDSPLYEACRKRPRDTVLEVMREMARRGPQADVSKPAGPRE